MAALASSMTPRVEPGQTMFAVTPVPARSAAIAVAGVIAGHPAWNTPDDAFDLMMRVNLYGVRHLADACVPAMVTAGRGRFVAVSSAAALRAMPMLAAYSAAKASSDGRS